jgi:catechol 2,3-dioxygenase-like lactoylglutathione lyase family enzyme
MRIGVTEIAVDDQEKARAFYTGVLGLEVKVDAPYGDGARWLTVVSPEDPGGTELLLAPGDEATAALQAARREHGVPAITFVTDDCERSYEELTARGAVFISPPQRRDYGGTDAVLEDGCGNLVNLHEAGASAPRVLAGLAVRDVDAALPWYERLFGRAPDARPMEILADYRFAGGGVVQLVADAERAGKSLLTLAVGDLERELSALRGRGVEAGPLDDTTSEKVLIASLADPDGNAITLVQQRT